MELRQLEYLVTVVDEGSFTQAAARLHVSQPAISAQLKKLEHELGEPLLDRGVRRVVPTTVGEAVLEQARAALAATDAVGAVVAEHAGLLTGRAAIGVIGSGLSAAFPDLLASFADRHPAVELSLTQEDSGDLLAGLLGGRYDVAVVGLAHEPPDGIATLNLIDDAVVAAVAPRHPFAERDGVRFADLAAHPLVVQPEGSGVRGAIDAVLDRMPVRPRIVAQAAMPQLLGELAVRGMGVALVPGSVVPLVEGLVAVPLTGPALRARVELAWPTARPVGPAGRALRDHLRTGLA